MNRSVYGAGAQNADVATALDDSTNQSVGPLSLNKLQP